MGSDRKPEVEETEIAPGVILFRPAVHRHSVMAAVAGFYGDRKQKKGIRHKVKQNDANKS